MATIQRKLPILSDAKKTDDIDSRTLSDIEAEIQKFEAEERVRLGLDRGADAGTLAREQWVDRMLSPTVRKHEREGMTILVSGLTPAQDYFVEGALSGQGYTVHWFGTADDEALRVGKEFGNRGQCNPTHFTVGNLVKHLIHLRDRDGLSTEEILSKYVFLTAGACGPCRFGMYVTEYRKALRDAGFDGFRVMLFQQQGGLSQVSGDDLGLVFDPPFFIAVAKALVCGDVINALGWRVRPYEIEKGATDRAVDHAKKTIHDALAQNTPLVPALRECQRALSAVKIDPLRCRAKVAVIGEFWALHTEGAGNYNLKRFIEDEGGECEVQPVVATLLYNIWEVARDTEQRIDLRGADHALWGLGELDELGAGKRLLSMRLANIALRGAFQAFANTMGLHGYQLPDMWRIAELAKEHYAHDLRGGEGHLEVGKVVLTAVDHKAHMIVSVKPFGCMPSSGVSDGVQSLVSARYPNVPFCALETSGDGATNFYSRVLMTLFAAKRSSEAELARAYEETGVTEAEVRTFLASHPRYASPLRPPAKKHGITGRAARLVYEVAPLLRMSRVERVRHQAKHVAEKALPQLKSAAGAAREVVTALARKDVRDRLEIDAKLLSEMLLGRIFSKDDATETTTVSTATPATTMAAAAPPPAE